MTPNDCVHSILKCCADLECRYAVTARLKGCSSIYSAQIPPSLRPFHIYLPPSHSIPSSTSFDRPFFASVLCCVLMYTIPSWHSLTSMVMIMIHSAASFANAATSASPENQPQAKCVSCLTRLATTQHRRNPRSRTEMCSTRRFGRIHATSSNTSTTGRPPSQWCSTCHAYLPCALVPLVQMPDTKTCKGHFTI